MLLLRTLIKTYNFLLLLVNTPPPPPPLIKIGFAGFEACENFET